MTTTAIQCGPMPMPELPPGFEAGTASASHAQCQPAADPLAPTVARLDRLFHGFGIELFPEPPRCSVAFDPPPAYIPFVPICPCPDQGYAPLPSPEPVAPAPDASAEATTGAGADELDPAVDPGAGAGPGAAEANGVMGFSVTSRELSFLDDKKLTIEEKLFRFMALMIRKTDQDLVAAMKRYAGKTSSSSSSSSGSTSGSSSSSGSDPASGSATASDSGAASSAASEPAPTEPYKSADGVWHTGDPGADAFLNDHSFGFLDDVVGAVGDVLAPVGDVLGELAGPLAGAAELVAKEMGGPLLAAAVTAVGFPELAPLALELGGALASSAVSGLASAVRSEGGDGSDAAGQPAGSGDGQPGSSTSGGSSAGAALASVATATTSSSGSVTPSTLQSDEKLEYLNLQRMVEKQTVMFTALTNTMKSLHEGQMAAVQNIR
jgi:hypothetical protein